MKHRNETVVQVPVSRLQPNPWVAEVGPPLSEEDFETLRLTIRLHGIQMPLVLRRRGNRLVVLAGMNRREIARELRMRTVPAIIRTYPDEASAKLFAVTDNLARRQMNTGQRAYLGYQYQQLIAVGAGRPSRSDISTKLSTLDARRSAAEQAGVSEGTVSAMKAVIESQDDDLLQSILAGRTAVHAAARYVRHEARTVRLPEPGRNGKPSDGTVYTVVHGDSADLIEQVARLYLRHGDVVCDVTVGQSVFWKKVELGGCEFHGTDIALKPSVDMRRLPYKDCSANVVVMDPPHQHDVGVPKIGATYNARRTVRKMSHDDIINQLYGGGLAEAWRVLKPGGLAWVKCCDEVVVSRQRWSHVEILEIAEKMGFTAIDLFILHRSAEPMLQHGRQLHARKNHSFVWILRKPGK